MKSRTTAPFGISPYSPVSRLYRNFIYIDMESVPEISRLSGSARTREKISAASEKASAWIIRLSQLSRRDLLQQAFEIFYRDHYLKETPRGRAFREYVQTEGAPLEKHALFLALSEYMQSEHHASAWPEWPEEYRSPESAAVEAFRKNNEKTILLFLVSPVAHRRSDGGSVRRGLCCKYDRGSVRGPGHRGG